MKFVFGLYIYFDTTLQSGVHRGLLQKKKMNNETAVLSDMTAQSILLLYPRWVSATEQLFKFINGSMLLENFFNATKSEKKDFVRTLKLRH